MTQDELQAFAESIAPVVHEHVARCVDPLRVQVRAAEERAAALEGRCRELQASIRVELQLRAVARAMRTDGVSEAGIVDAIAWCDAYYRTGGA
jgi:hypothetical protein